VTTLLGALVGTGAILPLDGALTGGPTNGYSITAGTVSGTPSPGLSFPSEVVPRDLTITGLSFTFDLSLALIEIGTDITMEAQLYEAPSGSNTYTAIPGTLVTAAPGLTGIISAGTIVTGSLTGLSIAVPAGDQIVEVVSATASGLIVNTITGNASVGVSGS
jgi:BclB C-terminal domain-containing protein